MEISTLRNVKPEQRIYFTLNCYPPTHWPILDILGLCRLSASLVKLGKEVESNIKISRALLR